MINVFKIQYIQKGGKIFGENDLGNCEDMDFLESLSRQLNVFLHEEIRRRRLEVCLQMDAGCIEIKFLNDLADEEMRRIAGKVRHYIIPLFE